MSKNSVIVLTGACGVGKSTISRIWAKNHAGVCIECDYFTEWIKDNHPITTDYFLGIEDLIADLTIVNTEQYLKRGFSVIIENVWSPKGLKIIKSRIEKNKLVNDLKFIYLKCNVQENMSRDKSRTSDMQMLDRVRVVNEELDQYIWPDFVHTIDNSSMTPQETLDKINAI